jgi:hypothetical protein
MKHLIVFLLLPLFLRGCDQFFFSPIIPAGVTTTLTLSDLFGRPSSAFHSGQDFDVQFMLANMTSRDICYSYSPPEMSFKISLGDSVVATSIDGMAFPAVIVPGCVRAGETYRNHWIAPNSPVRAPRISLPPGIYTVKALHPALADPRVPPLQPVRFTIIR